MGANAILVQWRRKERAEKPHWSQRALEQLSWQSRSQEYNCLNYSGMEEERSWGTSGHEFEELGSENKWVLDGRSINVEGQETSWGERMKWKVFGCRACSSWRRDCNGPTPMDESGCWITSKMPSKISLLISLSVSAVFKQEFTALAFVLSVFQRGLFVSSTLAVAQERWIALPLVVVPGAALGPANITNPKLCSQFNALEPCTAEHFTLLE